MKPNLPPSPSTALNPAADEYFPIAGRTSGLPLPPMKYFPRLCHQLPPPPSFFSGKLLPLPHQIIWAPVPYAYPPSAFSVAAKSTPAPTSKSAHKRLQHKEPAKLAGARPTFVVWRKELPPRALASKSALKKKPSARSNGAPPPAIPPEPAFSYPFGNCTTLMIRNIPNRLSRSELLTLLAEHCSELNKGMSPESQSEFDLVYLPVDFKRRGNLGYAFVNFTTVAGAAGLYRAWNGLGWNKYDSPKVRKITTAKLQGKEGLKAHLARLWFECDTDEYLPVEFSPACNGANLSDVDVATIGHRF